MTEKTLVEQALHLPRREARRWLHTPLDQEELVADGNLALAKAAKRYDPSYDVPFTAFARPYVRGAITDAVRARARRESLGDGTYADVIGFPDMTPRGDDGAHTTTSRRTPAPVRTSWSRASSGFATLATLPESERIALVRTIVDGDSASIVAKELGVSSHRVYALVHAGPLAPGSVRHDLLAGGDPRRAAAQRARDRDPGGRRRGRDGCRRPAGVSTFPPRPSRAIESGSSPSSARATARTRLPSRFARDCCRSELRVPASHLLPLRLSGRQTGRRELAR